MSDALVSLRDIYRIYSSGEVEVRALDGVNLDIHQGEFLAIMGPSGSGKSTLMNLLGCLDRPTSGAYFLAGTDVSKLDQSDLAVVRNWHLGFVFQNFNLLSRTSALENVELPLIYRGVHARERHSRAKRALERVGLGARIEHHPSQLSGGQQQRVAIARALVTEPKIILADEPTGNLDSHTSLEVMALFQELGSQGITVALVTHEPDIAEYATRVVVVRDGHIVTDRKQDARRASTDLQSAEAHA
ncbi:MAG TPA: ABC transporter ATP-binding protein [Polyangiaceae bacterium]|nr:ABC transporter ATP-binding protein [Polyangiaceae bacterium]